jgi:hypothetical protein
MKRENKSKAEERAAGNPAAGELRDRLKRTREVLGLSQSQAAAEWELPIRTLRAWENCQSLPGPFFLKLLLEWLDRLMERRGRGGDT